jgi:hypothetical protein
MSCSAMSGPRMADSCASESSEKGEDNCFRIYSAFGRAISPHFFLIVLGLGEFPRRKIWEKFADLIID